MMNISVSDDKQETGFLAAEKGAQMINEAIKKKGHATIILATGASQFEMLNHLVKTGIKWSKVEVFHLDEYIGIPLSHPASFRKYLKERFVEKVGNLRKFNYIDGNADDINSEIERLSDLISDKIIDVAFVGVGENGHLAFNDPPADFETEKPYLVVNLDEACRKQQLGEGWFSKLDDVPIQAVSMSVRQIIKSTHIINTVPDVRKAEAVSCALAGPVSTLCPASILQNHGSCHWFLDKDSASLLPEKFS
ncbi:glucosamine-6-phosphate deaminase [Marispirochaeta sp.]|jgi:glucosamine-6-phosphate deaminase|uniref:glucosamine-6-phosphate deaminase n=1 Tax=Marispirochaeta sp. TaxID=2038653 RepID=UPI0029C7B975|nr:glucosamine-6-phosphate deaminase [Marispirochaeta sp.]